MALTAGSELGGFRITGPLGKGGMGEVYRARDTRLDREVAVKTLPASLADDRDRLARFEREAKLLASLNHAHIASVYSLDEHDGTLYIAMELVEGETLEHRLKGGALPVGTALELAVQIANALEAAHGRGVVHRDLKPANVMITHDGVVKVLDFGLAKAFTGNPDEASPAHSPALSMAMTGQGLVLGTAGYMSPEQASGQATDQRADVWAFGVLLYEMLTGLPPFTGESVPHILADVLRTEPDWGRLPKQLHPRIVDVLVRCLEKKPRDRYHAIADVRIELEKAMLDPWGRQLSGHAQQSVGRRLLPVAAAALVTLVIGGAFVWSAWPSPERPILRFVDTAEPLGPGAPFRSIAISPDGRRYLLLSGAGATLREMDQPLPQRLSIDEAMLSPIFSPDGQQFAFWTLGSLRRMSIGGGASAHITDLPTSVPLPSGGRWSDDDMIVYATPDAGIFRVPGSGGESELLIPPRTDEIYRDPSLLPDGDAVLFTSLQLITDATAVVLESISTGDRTVLVEQGFAAHWLPSGHIVWVDDGTLFGAAFDLDQLALVGGAAPLVENIRMTRAGQADYAIAESGTLVYRTGASSFLAPLLATVVWVDRDGVETPIDGLPPRAYTYVQLSPDERSLALDVRDSGAVAGDIVVFDVESGTSSQLTFDAGANRGPLWLNDQVVFSRAIDGSETIWMQRRDGSGTPVQLTTDAGFRTTPTGVSPTTLLLNGAQAPDDVLVVRLDDQGTEAELLLASEAAESNAVLAPNERFVAFEYALPSAYLDKQVRVRPFPDVESGGPWQVTREGGSSPLWSADGSELFFLSFSDDGFRNRTVYSVAVDTTDAFRFGTPVPLFSGRYLAPANGRQVYDVSADGERFLMIKPVQTQSEELEEPEASSQIVVVQNWIEELKQRVPVE